MVVDYEKIQIIMAKKLMNVTELTKLSEMSAYGLYKVLNGKAKPTTKTVGKIARALNVNVEQIIKTE